QRVPRAGRDSSIRHGRPSSDRLAAPENTSGASAPLIVRRHPRRFYARDTASVSRQNRPCKCHGPGTRIGKGDTARPDDRRAETYFGKRANGWGGPATEAGTGRKSIASAS